MIADEHSLALAISLDYGVARFSREGERKEMGPVMSALVASPSRPDELAARLGESVLTVLRTLTDFEANGMVERLPDGRYAASRSYLTGERDRNAAPVGT